MYLYKYYVRIFYKWEVTQGNSIVAIKGWKQMKYHELFREKYHKVLIWWDQVRQK
jgi:hypothetical protein